jgi:hypothetical protein
LLIGLFVDLAKKTTLGSLADPTRWDRAGSRVAEDTSRVEFNDLYGTIHLS